MKFVVSTSCTAEENHRNSLHWLKCSDLPRELFGIEIRWNTHSVKQHYFFNSIQFSNYSRYLQQSLLNEYFNKSLHSGAS